MDHFHLGRVAFEARQFVEADAHLKRAETEEISVLRGLQFACAKILRPQTCWKELFALAHSHVERGEYDVLLELLDREEANIPMNRNALPLLWRAEIYYRKGQLAEARKFAVKHADYLLEKKLSPQLLEATAKYSAWFPQSLYFSLMRFQAFALLEDTLSARKQFIAIHEQIQRRWSKVEDKKENTKASLLELIADCAKTLDVSNGESVLLAHVTHLSSIFAKKAEMKKEDWKKLLEILVKEDSWFQLKLVLEIALQCQETDIAFEAYSQMKRKRGFSFVKLTKHDPHLKEWLLSKAGARPSRPDVAVSSDVLTPEDLALTEKVITSDMKLDFSDFTRDDEELKSVEMNAIKQLELHDVGIEALPDLVVAYRMMGFHRVVGWLLNKFPSSNGSDEFNKKLQYFRVIHSIDLKENYLALAIIEEMLGDSTLNLDEFKELKYAQGTLLMGLGRTKEAQQSFREVAKVDPGYRQTRERMNKIAQD